mgnify:CR=1 FL=1
MTTQTTTISLSVEIPEELHQSLSQYLKTHDTWGQDRAFCAALSLFLLQNGACARQITRIYLACVIGSPA